jgi:hypothetical protein
MPIAGNRFVDRPRDNSSFLFIRPRHFRRFTATVDFARMKRVDHLAKVFPVQVGVDLGRGYICMAQQFLNRTQVGSPFQ